MYLRTLFLLSEKATSVTIRSEPSLPPLDGSPLVIVSVGRNPDVHNLFQLRTEEVICAIGGFMNLSEHQTLAIKKWAEDAPYVKEVRLFGSRAKAAATENSDIDLAITVGGSDSRVVVDNYLSLNQRWREDLSRLLWSNVHVALYNDPANDMVRRSCDEHGVLLFP